LGLPEHVYNILTEAEHRTIGDLMMAMKLNPDSVLGLAGIGPKSMEAIKNALDAITFPEPEVIIEPIVEAQVEVTTEAPEETVPVITPGEVLPEPAAVEGEVATVAPGTTEEEIKEKPLEEIFTLRPDMLQPVAVAVEEDEDESDKKKGKKKKKKVVEIVYDEDLDKAIAKKKHKRGDEGWEEE
jgi:hypothetical protein